MRNITVSVPDDVYRVVRVRAAELDTTVTGLVRTYLESLVPGGAEFERLRRLQSQALDRLAASGSGFSAGALLSRDELHDRDALRDEWERSPHE